MRRLRRGRAWRRVQIALQSVDEKIAPHVYQSAGNVAKKFSLRPAGLPVFLLRPETPLFRVLRQVVLGGPVFGGHFKEGYTFTKRWSFTNGGLP